MIYILFSFSLFKRWRGGPWQRCPCCCVLAHLAVMILKIISCLIPSSTMSFRPSTGRIYVGAINNIYQLNYDLLKESSATTGPKKDNPHCTPPITAQCTDAKDMDNINKLLLVNSVNGTLIVCGSLFRGICSLVNLNSVDKQVYYSDTKGEKTYVASTEESVAVVGEISYFIDTNNNANLSVFVVGKGYGGSDSSKLISTRLLQEHGEMDVFENMVEASTVQASLCSSVTSTTFAMRSKTTVTSTSCSHALQAPATAGRSHL